MEIKTVSDFLCLSLSLFYQEKKKKKLQVTSWMPKKWLAERVAGCCDWTTPPLVFWLCYPLSPPAGCVHGILEMNLVGLKPCRALPPAALQNCYHMFTSLPLLLSL